MILYAKNMICILPVQHNYIKITLYNENMGLNAAVAADHRLSAQLLCITATEEAPKRPADSSMR